jgi:hypothetical protein
MLGLDQNAGYLLWAFGITVVVLAGYALYLRSRLLGLRRRRAAAETSSETSAAPPEDHSARNVRAAAPMANTAHVASSAKGPTTP